MEESKNDNKEIEKTENKEIKSSGEAKVIDELPKNKILVNKKIKTVYRLVYVFRNEDGYVNANLDNKMIDVIKKISKKLDIADDKLYIKYNDKKITENDNDLTVKKFFNFPKNKSRPILYVKIKTDSIIKIEKMSKSYDATNKSSLNNQSSYINYPNRVKIENYPSSQNINSSNSEDIYSIINSFLKEGNIKSDFFVEKKEKEKDIYNANLEDTDFVEENKLESNENNNNITYFVGFPTPDIAFDFKRYMNIFKLINPSFKDIKIQLLLGKKKSKRKLVDIFEEPSKNNYIGIYSNLEAENPEEKNKEVIAKIRNNYINNQMKRMNNINIFRYGYLNSSSPYSTPYDEILKDKHENRKKWLNPKGFITSVNKYSGIHF
jgi:hypothetical protein